MHADHFQANHAGQDIGQLLLVICRVFAGWNNPLTGTLSLDFKGPQLAELLVVSDDFQSACRSGVRELFEQRSAFHIIQPHIEVRWFGDKSGGDNHDCKSGKNPSAGVFVHWEQFLVNQWL